MQNKQSEQLEPQCWSALPLALSLTCKMEALSMPAMSAVRSSSDKRAFSQLDTRSCPALQTEDWSLTVMAAVGVEGQAQLCIARKRKSTFWPHV